MSRGCIANRSSLSLVAFIRAPAASPAVSMLSITVAKRESDKTSPPAVIVLMYFIQTAHMHISLAG